MAKTSVNVNTDDYKALTMAEYDACKYSFMTIKVGSSQNNYVKYMTYIIPGLLVATLYIAKRRFAKSEEQTAYMQLLEDEI